MNMLILTFILAAIIKESVGVKCYDCTHIPPLLSDDKCKDPFDNIADVTSTDCVNGCSKAKAENGDAQYVIRGCALLPAGDDCLSENVHGIEGHICYCNTDNCNASTTPRIYLLGMFVLLIVPFLLVVN